MKKFAYEMEDGTQFNCAYFDDETAFTAYCNFFADSAISPAGHLHDVWAGSGRNPFSAFLGLFVSSAMPCAYTTTPSLIFVSR